MNRFLFLLILFALLQTAKSQSAESDTVWIREFGGNGKGNIINAIFSPDDNSIFVTTTERFYEVNTETGDVIREIPQIRGMLKFVQENKFFISYDYKKYSYPAMIMVEDFQKSLNLGAMDGYDFDKDCSRMAVVKATQYPDFDSSVVIYEINTGKILYSFKTSETYHKIKFSPDGRFFATVSGDLGDITIQEDNQRVFRLWDAVNYKELKVLNKENTKTDYLSLFGFSPDNRYLAYINSTNLYLYNTETWQLVDTYTIDGFLLNSFTFSNDSKSIFLTESGFETHLYQINPKKLIKTFPPQKGSQDIIISNNNQYLISLSGYDVFLLYNSVTTVFENNSIKTFTISPNPIKDLMEIKGNLELIKDIQVYDLQGKVSFSYKKLTTNTEGIVINLTTLKAGVYLIVLKTVEQDYSIKFIKE